MKGFVVFVDLFSILAIALFLLFVLSAGEERTEQQPSYQVYELRFDGGGDARLLGGSKVPIGDLIELSATVCRLDETPSSGAELAGDFRVVSHAHFDGLRVVVSRPPADAFVRFSVAEVKKGEALDLEGIVYVDQVYPERRRQVFPGARVGAWPEISMRLQ